MVAAMIDVDYGTEAATPRLELELVINEPAVAENTEPKHRAVGMPFAVPHSQLYYWTQVWREGVEIAHAALARGDYVDFDSDDPDDVIRWLLGSDGD